MHPFIVRRRGVRGVSEPAAGETTEHFASRVRWQGFFLGLGTMFGIVMLFTTRNEVKSPR